MIRPRAIAAFSVAITCLVWQSACGGDSPTEPLVASVALSTDVVEVTEGGEVQLEATLTDDAGNVVTGVTPQWSSDAPSIATVDENGMVRGEAVGATKIRATYGDASAAADVSVVPAPGINVSPTEVAIAGGVGAADPDPRTLDVTSPGGPLEGLSVQVDYPSDPTGWLTAELGGTSAPTTITLTVVTQGLQTGVHAASVSVSSTTPGAGTVAVPVTLTLPSLAIQESDGSTAVDENGATDDFTVALSIQPASDVVLTVTSGDVDEVTVDPATLTFTSTNWNVAQTVTVTGVEDVEVDGSQAVDVTVAVDPTASDDAFDAMAPAVVTVTVADDDVVGVSEDVPQGHPGVLADDLVASYDMSTLTTDGLLRDFSGNGLHGTISGATPVSGVRGGGYSFSGDPAERIALPSASQFDLDGPLTVAAWFRIDTPNQHQHVIACDDKFVLWLKASDAVRLANTRSDYAETVGPLSSGEFHSVVGVFHGTAGDPIDTSNLQIFFDGVPVEIFVGSAVSPPVWRDGVLYPSDACYIGFESHQGRADHADLGFYGVIDEVLVFGRALTPEEVALLAGTTP